MNRPHIQIQLSRIDGGWPGSRDHLGQASFFSILSLSQPHLSFPFKLFCFQPCVVPRRSCYATFTFTSDARLARSDAACVVQRVRAIALLLEERASKAACEPSAFRSCVRR